MENFYFITHDITNPQFNLAMEEYLLKQKSGYYVCLWRNSPAVIIGVNQNAYKEVNLSYTEENGIEVVRRITGGGAVYHDLNNICYTVIAPYNENENRFQKFTAPVIEYLKSLGLNAQLSGRNDILLDGKKISGSAETVFNDRVMHHGTLLFKTDVNVLSNALNPSKLKIESKGISSVRSRVTNISECLKKDITVVDFMDNLEKFFLKTCSKTTLNNSDVIEIEKLIEQKYSTYEWNMGRSPNGRTLFEHKFDFGILSISFDIENAIMKNVKIEGDFFSLKDIKGLEEKLENCKFIYSEVKEKLAHVDKFIVGAKSEEILSKMFL